MRIQNAICRGTSNSTPRCIRTLSHCHSFSTLSAAMALCACCVVLPVIELAGAQYEIDWYTIDGGGGTSSGGPFELTGTIGQPDTAFSSNSTYALQGGFWSFLFDAGVDSDGDGMPDSFEQTFGFDPHDPSDAAGDSDGDGRTNIDEFHACTDPTDPASSLRIVSVEETSAGIVIRFQSVAGKQYQLQRNSAMLDPAAWTVLMGNVEGTGGVVELLDTTASALTWRFYRILQ